MAKKLTGMEKFMAKQFGSGGVKIATPDDVRQVAETPLADIQSPETPKDDKAGKTPVQAAEQAVARRRGRPAKTETVEMETIYLKIDRGLKWKLEQVKHISYKSTLKDVIVEAMNDICQKYGV